MDQGEPLFTGVTDFVSVELMNRIGYVRFDVRQNSFILLLCSDREAESSRTGVSQ
jgi:hypothetical protein